MTARTRIVVIGAGHNGLTAATYLARAGHEVVVVEARGVAGGMAARESFGDGFAAPGLLHDTRAVSRRVVDDLGLAQHGLAWREAPAVWVPGSDSGRDGGGGIWIEPGGVRGDLADGDADRYGAFLAFVARVRKVLGGLVDAPPPDPRGKLWPLVKTAIGTRRLGKRDMMELLRVAPMSVADWMGDVFHGERLRGAVAMPALEGAFAGPRSPHTASTLLLGLCASGDDALEVRGGPAALTNALAKAARAAGVTIRTGARVTRVRLTDMGEAVRAVEVAAGDDAPDDAECEEIAADTVVASCDPKQLFLALIGAEHLPARLAGDVGNIRARGTTAKVHLALSAPLTAPGGEASDAQIGRARIGGTLDDLERAFDAVKYGGFSERPMLDVSVSPAGGKDNAGDAGDAHVVSILAHFAAYDLRGGWTDERRDALGRAVIDRLAEHVPGVREQIIASEVLTPHDITDRYGTTGGHIHHGEHAPDQLLFMRPTLSLAGYATPVRGLYLCGSGSHPGGGITCRPGALAARAITGR